MSIQTLTHWDLNTLRCAAAAGSSFQSASEEIGRSHTTVRAALRHMGLLDEFKRKFASGRQHKHFQLRTDGAIVVLDADTIHRHPPRVPDTPQSQWLAKAWRAA